MFNVHDWYWSGTPGIYGSARGGLVATPATDPAYVAWQALGNLPTPWPGNGSVAALDDVLSTFGLSATGLAVPTVAQLRASLIDAASTACASIIMQITPDATHQAAYQNAAAIVNANGNAAPTSAPLQAKFAALATQAGAASSAAFAAIVVAVQGASLDLSTALIALKTASIAATTSAALATALTAFDAALAAVVTEVNAAVLSPITAPAAISIVGINA